MHSLLLSAAYAIIFIARFLGNKHILCLAGIKSQAKLIRFVYHRRVYHRYSLSDICKYFVEYFFQIEMKQVWVIEYNPDFVRKLMLQS